MEGVRVMKIAKIIRNILLLIVFIEFTLLVLVGTNKLVELKDRVDKLETQIVELKGDR